MGLHCDPHVFTQQDAQELLNVYAQRLDRLAERQTAQEIPPDIEHTQQAA